MFFDEFAFFGIEFALGFGKFVFVELVEVIVLGSSVNDVSGVVDETVAFEDFWVDFLQVLDSLFEQFVFTQESHVECFLLVFDVVEPVGEFDFPVVVFLLLVLVDELLLVKLLLEGLVLHLELVVLLLETWELLVKLGELGLEEMFVLLELLGFGLLVGFLLDKGVEIASGLVEFSVVFGPVIFLINFALFLFFFHGFQFLFKPKIVFFELGDMFPERLLVPTLPFHFCVLFFLLMGLLFQQLESLVDLCPLLLCPWLVEVFENAVHVDAVELQFLVQPLYLFLSVGELLSQQW